MFRTQGPKRDKFAGLSRRAKRRKLALEEDAGETAAVRAAVRSVKKSSRPTKIGLPETRKQKPAKGKSSEKKKRKVGRVTGVHGMFEREMGAKRKGHVSEGARSNKAEQIGGVGRKGSKNKAKAKGKR